MDTSKVLNEVNGLFPSYWAGLRSEDSTLPEFSFVTFTEVAFGVTQKNEKASAADSDPTIDASVREALEEERYQDEAEADFDEPGEVTDTDVNPLGPFPTFEDLTVSVSMTLEGQPFQLRGSFQIGSEEPNWVFKGPFPAAEIASNFLEFLVVHLDNENISIGDWGTATFHLTG
jgi:hypothetical protein